IGEKRLRSFNDFVADARHGLADRENLSEVDGSGDEDEIAGSALNGFLELATLGIAVAHCRKEIREMRILGKSLKNGADGIGTGIDHFGSAESFSSYYARAIRHFTMR